MCDIDKFVSETSEILNRLRCGGDAGIVNRANLVEKKLKNLLNGIETLRANNSLLTIGIVGQMNVGKSSFLNALFFGGNPVLPKAATPMTAGLTIIEKSPEAGENFLEIEFYTQNDWDSIRATAEEVKHRRAEILKQDPELVNNEAMLKTLLKNAVGDVDYASYEIVQGLTPVARAKIGKGIERVRLGAKDNLTASLDQYVGARGTFTSVVKAIHLYLDDSSLNDIRIVDTPGVNDPVVTRDAKTSEFLREAHGILMLMSAGSFLTGSEIDFLNKRIGGEGIPSVVMVVNKIDMPCCSGSYTEGYSLANALDEICADLKSHFETHKQFFDKPEIVKGVVFTSGVANSLSQKIEKSPETIDPDERHTLNLLKEYYPDDFNDDNIMDSLELLAFGHGDLGCYIKNEFYSKKNRLMSEKLSSFIEEHRNDVLQAIDESINETKNEINILKNESHGSLNAQLDILRTMLATMLPQIETEINGFVRDLENSVKGAFQTKLEARRPYIAAMPTDAVTIKYTREGVKFGLAHSGLITISLLNSNELCRMEDPQVDNLRTSVHKFWNETFMGMRDSLATFILDNLTKMAIDGVDANLNDSVARNLVNNLIRVELNGMETLELIDICEEFKSEFRSNMADVSFTDLSTSLGKMDQLSAERSVNERVKQNLESALIQTKRLNGSLYSTLEGKCYEQCRRVSVIMEQFRNSFIEKLNGEIGKLTARLTKKLNAKEASIASATNSLNDFIAIKNKFISL